MTSDLNDIFKPGETLPPDEVMVAKALEILEQSPHGQQLVNFVEKKGIDIKVMATPEPVAYLPEKKLLYIGFNRAKPISPSHFILLLAGALREAQQEAAGIKMPPFQAPVTEHQKVAISKLEDKMWYICTIAWELNSLESFTEFKFLDELKKMGHNEVLELYLKQEGKA